MPLGSCFTWHDVRILQFKKVVKIPEPPKIFHKLKKVYNSSAKCHKQSSKTPTPVSNNKKHLLLTVC